jgi:hypothetical protein
MLLIKWTMCAASFRKRIACFRWWHSLALRILSQNESPALPDSSLICDPIAAKGRAWAGRNTGSSMFGHFRFAVAAFLLVAAFATPATSNPLSDLFSPSPNAAPVAAAAAPTPAQEECLLQPGKSTAPGQHWVYHHDGHRRCWFQAEAGPAALARKPVHRHVARQSAVPEENEPAPRRQEEAVEDTRAEMLRSASAEVAQSASHAPEIKLVDAAAVPSAGVTELVPATQIVGNATRDQVTPEHPKPPQLNEEVLLAAAPAVRDAVDNFANSAAPIAVSTPEVSAAGRWSMASWLGALLMALGGVTVFSASRTRRRAAQFGSVVNATLAIEPAKRRGRGAFGRAQRNRSNSIFTKRSLTADKTWQEQRFRG